MLSANSQSGRRSRICMLAYAFYESDTRILQYATALALRGDIVDVIALKREKEQPDFQVLDGVNVYRIQSRTVNERSSMAYATRILRFLFRAAWFLFRKQRQPPYDLIHVHNVPDFLVYAAAYPRLKGVPVILDIHDLLPEFYASKFKIDDTSHMFRLLTFIEWASATFASHVIVANHLWKERYAERSCSATKCSVVRNHPDTEIFRAQRPAANRDTGEFTMIYPGSLNWHQGLDVAIQAFARIADRIPEARFHIYGEGPAKPALRELASSLGLQQQVLFHDFLPSRDVARIMAQADLAIEPKRSTSAFGNEALSTKILEFMVLGVPVIASRTTIHSYYYDDSIVRYYDRDDPDALAANILDLKNNPEKRRQQVANAKRYAAENTWNARQEDYLQLVNSLTGNNRTTVTPAIASHRAESAGVSPRV